MVSASQGFRFIAIMLFVGALCLPMATGLSALLGGGEARSAKEQRKLNPWPTFPETLPQAKQWPRRFSAWFDDRFGLRRHFINLHNYGKAWLGVSPSEKVVIGRDGWLFIDSAHLTDANRGARPFPEAGPGALAELFLETQDRLAQRGIAYIHLTPPDKQSLYFDQLPGRIRRVGDSRYDQWRDAAMRSRLNFVDVFPAIQRARKEGSTPFMQSDSHWNCKGAYVAYRALMAGLNKNRPVPLPVVGEDEVRFVPRDLPQGGDIARNSMGVPYLFPDAYAFTCPIGESGKANASYTAWRTGEPLALWETYRAARPSRVVNHDFPEGPRALVLRDSFTNAMIPFLNRSFGEVVYMAHTARPLRWDVIDEVAPDIVIYEHVERTLTRFDRLLGEPAAPSDPDGR